VFVSVVCNEDVLAQSQSLLHQLDPSLQQSQSLPEITEEGHVFRVGSLATVKAVHDKANPFLPYYLTLFPTQKAQISSFIDKVGPLCRVATADVHYTAPSQSSNQQMYHQFMKQTFHRLIKIAPDKKFKEILQYMIASVAEDDAEMLMYQTLTILSMP